MAKNYFSKSSLKVYRGKNKKCKLEVVSMIAVLVLINIIIVTSLFFKYLEYNDNKDDNKYYISSEEYFVLLDRIFYESTKSNEYLYYDGYTNRFPYLQVFIKPRKKIEKTVMNEQAKIIGSEIITQLKKYEYDSTIFFDYNYEYLNIHFWDYTDNNVLNWNAGPFMQIEILNIDKITLEDVIHY